MLTDVSALWKRLTTIHPSAKVIPGPSLCNCPVRLKSHICQEAMLRRQVQELHSVASICTRHPNDLTLAGQRKEPTLEGQGYDETPTLSK